MPLTKIKKPSSHTPKDANEERIIRIRTEKDFFGEHDESEAYAESADDFDEKSYDEAESYAASADDDDTVEYAEYNDSDRE